MFTVDWKGRRGAKGRVVVASREANSAARAARNHYPPPTKVVHRSLFPGAGARMTHHHIFFFRVYVQILSLVKNIRLQNI